MPRVKNAKLTLPRDGANVTINITFDVVFSQFERRLAHLGLAFQDEIALIGVDPPGGTTGDQVLTTLRSIPVSDGAGELTVHRVFTTPFSRNSLDEDPSGPFSGPDADQDEYRGRIRILAIGLPPAVTRDAFTDQAVLGLVAQPVAAG
ncbi:MAG TPA: hypothetical protein VHS05_10930 [Pyrinomonadaceae bacterium]|jgi:hypothetical protein|nr:hypothetical protein [Pyrinomonadaceae bacterium]